MLLALLVIGGSAALGGIAGTLRTTPTVAVAPAPDGPPGTRVTQRTAV